MINPYSSPNGASVTTSTHSVQALRLGRQAYSPKVVSHPANKVQGNPLPKQVSPHGELKTDGFVRRLNVGGIPVTYESEDGLDRIQILGADTAKKLVKAELKNSHHELETVDILSQLERSIQRIPQRELRTNFGQSLRDTVKKIPTVSSELKDVFSKSVKDLIS